MYYVGSKNRISKHILPLMLKARKPKQWWVEPFVGGANIIDKITGNRKIGNDINKYIIALLKSVKSGYVPPINVSKDFYYAIKKEPDNYPDELVGFVAIGCSFGGKWFGGYANNKSGRNYAKEASNSLVKQAPNLRGVNFTCGSYKEMTIPRNSLIYCDPPYDTKTKAYINSFDNYTEFWQWCREKSSDGHMVYVSSYDAPSDFEIVVSIEHITTLNKNKKNKRIEKLFIHNKTRIK